MSVKKNKKGVYYYTFRFTDPTGKVVQVHKQSKQWRTKREATEVMHKHMESIRINPNTMKYSTLFNHFLEHKSSKVKKRTTLTYQEVNSTHILPYFGNMIVDEISKDAIRKWQLEISSQGFSNAYLKNIQSNFKRVLNWGKNHELINRNPFTIEFFKKDEKRKEMLYYTLDEFNKFLSAVNDKTDSLIFSLLYWCGLRKGELQALSFDDIDFEKNLLKVHKSYDSRNQIVTTPKNLTSYREIYLPEFLSRELLDYINHCKRIAGFSRDLFLFGIDKPISSTTLERKKNKYTKLANVKQIRLHDFRHSHVSLLINEGYSAFEVGKRLGHSPDMVNNVYGHWFDQSQISMANKLNHLFESSKV